MVEFIVHESKTYQRLNLQRIDASGFIHETDRQLLIDFYGRAIANLIVSLIEDASNHTIEKHIFITITTRMIKNYIENYLHHVIQA